MRVLLIVGLLVLAAGIVSFFVGVPHSESHGISVGGASVGVQTHHSDRLPPWGSALLVVGGIVLIAVGGRAK